MKLHYAEHGALGVVTVEADRVDASVAIRFKDEFRALVGERGPNIVLDLSQVQFLDSSGLGAVVGAKKLLGRDRQLSLAGLQPAVDKVMTMTRMNTVFSIHGTVQTAVAAG